MNKEEIIDSSKVEYTLEYLRYLFHKGSLIDARKGGLVLGKPHPERGQILLNKIHLLYILPNLENFLLGLKTIENEKFSVYGGSIEGGEYILCSDAVRKYGARIDELNKDEEKIEPLTTISITKNTRVINAFSEDHTYLLINSPLAGWGVVRQYATTRNLEELELMNALLK